MTFIALAGRIPLWTLAEPAIKRYGCVPFGETGNAAGD
jgi:hypothetical protein